MFRVHRYIASYMYIIVNATYTIFSQFDLPPTYLSFAFLVLDALLYGLLAWYLDAVIRGNHGIPRKW